MKFSDICERLKTGEFTVNNCGHKVNDPLPYILGNYEKVIANANGANDGNWDKEGKYPDKNWDADMREYYQRELDMDYPISVSGMPEYLFRPDGKKCFCCGEDLKFPFNGKGLSLNVRYNDKANHFEFLDSCECANLTPLTVDIDITDKLVLANWMPDYREDTYEDEKYSREYDLNSAFGRRNIAIWKAQHQNVGYTQTGSCGSVYIWLNKDKTQGFLTSYVDELDEKNSCPFLKGYKNVGMTDVAVWRVEMADTAKINLETLKQKHSVVVVVKVPKGKWALTSYYDIKHKLGPDILAEIKYCEGRD